MDSWGYGAPPKGDYTPQPSWYGAQTPGDRGLAPANVGHSAGAIESWKSIEQRSSPYATVPLKSSGAPPSACGKAWTPVDQQQFGAAHPPQQPQGDFAPQHYPLRTCGGAPRGHDAPPGGDYAPHASWYGAQTPGDRGLAWANVGHSAGAYGPIESWKSVEQRSSPYATTPKSSGAPPSACGKAWTPVDQQQFGAAHPPEQKAEQGTNAEPSRDAQPLQLMKDRSPELAWQSIVENPHLRSWAYVAHEPAITMDDFATLRDRIPWVELKSGWGDSQKLTRKVMWFTRIGCTCPYEYGSECTPAMHFPDWFDAMTERWLCKLKLKDSELGMPNCANINLYDGGEQAVSWHSDDEPLFKGKTQDACIISVSLGAARKFQVGLRAPRKGAYLAPEKGSIESAWLEHGHLATMEGLFQKHYLHQVAKAGQYTEPRINVTFRYNVAHVAPCRLAPPSIKEKTVVWLSLPASAPFLKRGVQQWAPAINHCAKLQQTGLPGYSSYILSDILGSESGDVEMVDDVDWKTFPEIGAAYQEVGGEEVSFCVAIHPRRSAWAVGFAGKSKVRMSAARLALCIALLQDPTADAARIVNKYEGLAQVLEESKR